MSAIFVITHDWQDVPPGAVLPPGCQIQMNLETGRQQARWANGNGYDHQANADPLAGLDDAYADAAAGAETPQGQGGPAPLSIIDPTAWQGLPVPERKWHVRGWMPDNHVSSLYGDGGTGKSLLAQQLLTATAIGQPWLGLETKHCRAIGIFCEDREDELHRRQDDINRLYGCDFRDLGGLRLLSRVGLDNLLMTFTPGSGSHLTAFFGQILAWARDFGANFVVVDTAADTFGGNENARPEVRQFIQTALGGISNEINGAVLLCAHPSRSGIASGKGDGGSTGWSNSVRSRMHLYVPQAEAEGERDTSERILELPKVNYAAMGSMIKLRWVEGAFRPDEKITGATPGMTGNIERNRAESVFLELLARTKTEGRRVSPSKQAPSYAPKAFVQMPDRQGLSRIEFQQAMERLFAKGLIKAVPYGRDRSLEIVRCTPEERQLDDLDELLARGQEAA